MIHLRNTPLTNYLARYASLNESSTVSFECLDELFSQRPSFVFDHCLVVPAYVESISCLFEMLSHQSSSTKLLVILIINQPYHLREICESNKRLWNNVSSWGHNLVSKRENQLNTSHTQLVCWQNSQTHILAIDQFSEGRGIPKKHGVGLARKIGFDIACYLISMGLLKSSWIHSTDADTSLPSDYFEATQNRRSITQPNANCNRKFNAPVAMCFPFLHEGNNDAVCNATRLYEYAIEHYVEGLRNAGSPYAYHSLGSCLAVNATAYAKVRGFPKKSGGEDFYLLNKLAKIGSIAQANCKPLRIKARLSHRAPFGTGVAVSKILRNSRGNQPSKMKPCKQTLGIDIYHEVVFNELKALLETFHSITQHETHKTDNKNTATALQHALQQLSTPTQAALQHIGIEQLFKHLHQQNIPINRADQHIHQWFDAFKTLKFIHYLQQHHYPKRRITINELNEISPKLARECSDADVASNAAQTD